MIEQLSQFCPSGHFNEPWEYNQCLKYLDELLASKKLVKFRPKVLSQWDIGSEFYRDTETNLVYKLSPPEAPSRGQWIEVQE